MQFGLNRLGQWLERLPGGDELLHRLPLCGFEVASLDRAAPPCSGVRVARVLSAEPHPNADKLRLCRVDDGQQERQIVCGAPNARAGIVAALAVPGAELPGGLTIKASFIRGVESQGMLCSSHELGLGDDHEGIIELEQHANIGQDLRKALDLDEQIIALEITPNRGDCLSLLGVAREVGAIFDIALRQPDALAAQITISLDAARGIKLAVPEACPAYFGRVVRLARPPGPSPRWMAQALERAGLRPINLLVDITNYVMLELGQPLHAFDNTKLHGDIQVRLAKKGEHMQLLNDQQVEAGPQHLLITDANGPVALGGVMGGASSAVDDETTEIFLEAAHFTPSAVAGRSRQLKLASEACFRFERGVDPQLPQRALDWACALLGELSEAAFGPVCSAVSEAHMPQRVTIDLDPQRLNRLAGLNLPPDFCARSLTALGFDMHAQQGKWRVTPPSWRLDVELEQDVLEELVRLYGLDKLPDELPLFTPKSSFASEAVAPLYLVEDHLVGLGYQESINYSFISKKEHQCFSRLEPIRLANPITEEMAVMRPNLFSSLLRALDVNYRHQLHNLRMFETGLSYVCSQQQPGSIVQKPKLAMASAGLPASPNWRNTRSLAAGGFYHIKGDVESLFGLTGGQVAFVPLEDHPGLHPGRSATIVRDGQPIGLVGEVHPGLLSHYAFGEHRPLVAEIDLEALLTRPLAQFSQPSRLPGASRDFAFVLNAQHPYSRVEALIRAHAGPFLRSITPFDVFSNQSLPQGYHSLAVRLVWNNPKATLSDKQIAHFSDKVVNAMQAQLGASLRG